MTDRYIEKSFLYLLGFSLAFHVALFALIALMPTPPQKIVNEPLMVDLQDIPEVKKMPESTPTQQEVKRHAEQRQRVVRETAPRGDRERDQLPLPVQPQQRPVQQFPSQQPQRGTEPAVPRQPERGDVPVRGPSPKDELFRSRNRERTDIAKLMPSANTMARLEDQYRKKFSEEVAEGETRFLNTDDILFGSFLRRFETAVYGVWRYPSEAAKLGIEGVTPVRITFNRKGEIVSHQILQSSGSRILDDEVARTLNMIGAVGPFPKAYDKDTFNLIAFFQYGIMRGASRTLH